MGGRRPDPQTSRREGPMIEPAEWVKAYARQADADLKAWELYEKNPEAVAAECHKLLFLQMACEKLSKAYLIQSKKPPEDLQGSHGDIAKNLRIIVKPQIIHLRQNLKGMQGVLTLVRHLAE